MNEENNISLTLPKAERIIYKHVLWSMASASLPIHIVDAIGVMLVQNDMIKQLCRLYEFDYNQNLGKSIVASLITTSSAKGFSMLFKNSRGAERVLMAALSGALTYGFGRFFISNFEKGISLIDIDLKAGEELFDEYFEKGKEVVSNMTK